MSQTSAESRRVIHSGVRARPWFTRLVFEEDTGRQTWMRGKGHAACSRLQAEFAAARLMVCSAEGARACG
ncbi:MAG TPA: hypothetical protein VES67_19710 [Vicinamibacterales bacterium]|nr:hypothetical protein [Vicinamibacterales bacterium]